MQLISASNPGTDLFTSAVKLVSVVIISIGEPSSSAMPLSRKSELN